MVRRGTALVVADQLTVERPLPRTSAVEGGAWSGVKRKAADLDGGGWWALVPLVSVVVGKRSGQGGLLCPPPPTTLHSTSLHKSSDWKAVGGGRWCPWSQWWWVRERVSVGCCAHHPPTTSHHPTLNEPT